MAAAIRVLYVDDEPALLDLCKMFLEDDGVFSVETIESAPAALDLLKKESFDAIVSDYLMPVMDGIRFLAEVRTHVGKIPFILFTGKGREEIVIEAINKGADFYLQKGGDPVAQYAELAQKIRAAVEQRISENAFKESENRYRSLVDTMHDCVAVYRAVADGEDFVFVDFNNAAEITENMTRQEVVGRRVTEVFPGVQEFGILDVFRRVWRTGTPESFPVTFYQDSRISGWRDNFIYKLPSGEIVAGYRDETAKKLAEDALVESESFNRSLVENLPDYIVVYGLDGKILYVNPASAKVLEYHSDELVGTPLFSYVAMEYRNEVISRIAERRERGEVPPYEIDILTRGGLKRSVIVKGTQVRYHNSPATLLVLTDITDRKREEEKLRQTRDYLENIFAYANAPIIVWNPQFEITRFNHAFEELTGRKEQDVLGKHLKILFPKESCTASMVMIQKALSGERWEIVEIPILNTISGEVKIVLWNSANILTPDGSNVLATIAQGQDITERKMAEKSLLQEKNFSDRLFDAPQDTVFLFEPATGKPVRWNKCFADESGYSAEEIAGMKAPDDFYSEEDLNKAKKAMAGLSEGNITIELSLITKQGTQIPFEYSATAIEMADGRTFLLSMGRNITERKRAEAALRESEVRFRTMTDWTSDWEYWIGTNREFIYISPSVERITGYTPGEFTADPELIKLIVHPDDRARWEEHCSLHAEAEQTDHSTEMEFRIIQKNGSPRWIGHTCRAIFNPDGTWAGRRISNQDISGRKTAEEDLVFKNALLSTQQETLPGGILIVNENGKILNYNHNFVAMWGIPEDVLASRSDERALQSVIEKLAHPEEFLARVKYLQVHIYDKSYDEVRLKDGRILDRYSSPMFGEKQRYFGRVWYFRDITDLKKSEADLLSSLHDKELLLKEIHHRVKNNLQTIASLLYLQSLSTDDEAIKKLLNEARSRVYAMGLIHQKLYQSADITRIPFTDYISQLIEYLKESYGVDETKIRISISVKPEDLFFDLDTGIPCGLIINELVMNALKYAFRNRPGGTITIHMSRDETGQNLLIVSDDGHGISEDFDLTTMKSLGMTIVASLVRQLGGTMEMIRHPGTTITIRFPTQAPLPPHQPASHEKPGAVDEPGIDEKIKRIRARHD